MQVSKHPITISSIHTANARAKKMIDDSLLRAKNLAEDPEKENRLKECKCLSCYYIMRVRIGGAAMTNKPCGICERIMVFSSTATDHLCDDCGKENNLCVQCGADIELKTRIKKYPFQNV